MSVVKLKRYNSNGIWSEVTPRRWTGSRWAEYSDLPFYWDGVKWTRGHTLEAPPVTKSFTKTFSATWSQSYDGDSNINNANNSVGSMYQGKYGKYDPTLGIHHNPVYFGIQRSLFGFNVADIQKELSGATITKIEVYLKNIHFWYFAGGKASIISHNFSSKPNKFNYVGRVKEESFVGRGQGRWITLPISVGNDLKSGRITGFGLFKNSEDLDYYGYFAGASSVDKPQIRVHYTKNYHTTDDNDVIITDEKTIKDPTYITYSVVHGDTLWSVSQKYNVTVSQLQQWNNLTTNMLYTGDKLKIYTNIDETSAPATTPKYTYVLVGEGLVQVTERLMRQGLLSSDFTTARRTLMTLNGFTTSAPVLQPNQKIMYSRG